MSASTSAQISYEKVGRTFSGDFTAVSGIDLDVERGEFVCIIGPSGCGKSTLLNMAAGLLKPTEGEVRYGGRPVTAINTDVGYITQADNLLPWRTVARNVSLPLELHRLPRRERKERVTRMLETVGLSRFAKRYPSQLSGGMRKRVALAQTWVYEPHTLLMDEPFGALDAQLRLRLQEDLLATWARIGSTVLFVTHDLEEAILLADRVVVFGTDPGRIVHVESIPFDRPRELSDIRTTPEFLEIWNRLWDLLERQIKPGMDEK